MSCYERLFTGAAIAAAYQKFRPTYPKGVVERIISYLGDKKPGPYNLAVDVGCGSGQSTRILGDYFEQVIGCDVSESQIREAIGNNISPNVEYRNGSDRNIPAADCTVDLVTSAQASHWFNRNKFYKEVDRVLKPRGCFAVYGYGFAQLQSNTNGKQLQSIYDDFFRKPLYGLLRDEIKQVEQRYTHFSMPYAESERDDTFSIEIDYSVADFVGYLSSTATYNEYLKVNPDKQHVLVEVEKINGSDRNIPAADHTVDLVTSAQAAHWFNRNQFYKEVDRVLMSKGCLAVYGYGFRSCKFVYKTLDGFWEDGVKHFEQHYTRFTMPYAESERLMDVIGGEAPAEQTTIH
ncbi:putative methyltransferase DDB_G0268948, partial [Saccoglossus kowalevskii]